jgi:hypothetical protein
MAEPLSSHEIEDVLSSIRRLVAQDLKPADRAKLAAVADISQKLVLTPENRVEERGDAPKFVTVRRPTRRPAFPAIDEVLPSMDATARRTPESAPRDANFNAPVGLLSAAEFIAPQPAPFTLEPSARLSQVAPEEFATDGFDHHDPSDDRPLDPHDIAPVAQAWTEEPDDIDQFVAHEQPIVQSFEGTIEPDTDWADAAEARVIAELAGEAMQDTVVEAAQSTFRNPSFGPMAAPDVMFDEQALRSLVQTIFREEMAGPMGERITRNIRKLVRAEVGRMLAAHDLE